MRCISQKRSKITLAFYKLLFGPMVRLFILLRALKVYSIRPSKVNALLQPVANLTHFRSLSVTYGKTHAV